ncbi:sulfotransferase family protein [Zhongshania marina]|uniref:Sulfotransferase n=1 Tax=Zhongshania marina TaxID=2304603 RepID=A0ABX9W5S4_9GAMM|nr:sulfotransferase [Zhongshania marina]
MSVIKTSSQHQIATTAGEFIALAEQQAKLNFTDRHFEEPLQKLLECLARDADFHEQGAQIFKSEILRYLNNRLRMQADVEENPDIFRENVDNPIIITGLGRSGTTKLQNMLSVPSKVQKMYFWRLWNAARLSQDPLSGVDPRIALASGSDLISEDKPELDAAHHIESCNVDEDWMLYFYTFEDWGWCQISPCFSFYDWVKQRPDQPVYSYVKQIIQYLQWQDGGKRERPWVMKSIGHIAHLETLVGTYPEATIVHTHRHPAETIASWCKFLCSVWAIQCNPVDPKVLGREMLRQWSEAMEACMTSRKNPKVNDRIIDVQYHDIRLRPMDIIDEIYVRAGVKLTDAERNEVANWHTSKEQGRFGKHEYSLEEFGLNAADIDNAFGNYIEAYL